MQKKSIFVHNWSLFVLHFNERSRRIHDKKVLTVIWSAYFFEVATETVKDTVITDVSLLTWRRLRLAVAVRAPQETSTLLTLQ